MASPQRSHHSSVRAMALALALLLLLPPLSACTSIQTATGSDPNVTRELKLQPGDEVSIITSRRERLLLRIDTITETGLQGETLLWEPSDIAPGQKIVIPFAELAFVQVEKEDPVATAGLVAVVSLAGALVMAVSAVPVVVFPP